MGTSSLSLRVSPGAAGTVLVGRHGGGWKLRVAAPPERGRANEAVLDLLARTLRVPRAHRALVSGHTGRDKRVSVLGLEQAETERRLAARGAR